MMYLREDRMSILPFGRLPAMLWERNILGSFDFPKNVDDTISLGVIMTALLRCVKWNFEFLIEMSKHNMLILISKQLQISFYLSYLRSIYLSEVSWAEEL